MTTTHKRYGSVSAQSKGSNQPRREQPKDTAMPVSKAQHPALCSRGCRREAIGNHCNGNQ